MYLNTYYDNDTIYHKYGSLVKGQESRVTIQVYVINGLEVVVIYLVSLS